MSGLPFERLEDPNPVKYHDTAHMARAAMSVVMYGGEISTDDFAPYPCMTDSTVLEPGDILTEKQDFITSFMGAYAGLLYGYSCGRAESLITPDSQVRMILQDIDETIAYDLREAVTQEAIERLFFESGAWRILLSPDDPQLQGTRTLLSQEDFGGLRHDPDLIKRITDLRREEFTRHTRVLPHATAHLDIGRIMNVVLRIGEDELGIQQAAELEAHVVRNFSLVKQLALLSIGEIGVASRTTLADPQDYTVFDRKFFKVDADTGVVSLDEQRVLAAIDEFDPNFRKSVRRGCPALFLKTNYHGQKVPMFEVAKQMMLKIYKGTGALTDPELRYVDYGQLYEN